MIFVYNCLVNKVDEIVECVKEEGNLFVKGFKDLVEFVNLI